MNRFKQQLTTRNNKNSSAKEKKKNWEGLFEELQIFVKKYLISDPELQRHMLAIMYLFLENLVVLIFSKTVNCILEAHFEIKFPFRKNKSINK